MDQKEENEAITKWDCHLNSCLYDTYDVVAIGNQLDSFIMKFPFFGSSRRLSLISTTSVSNAASAASAAAEHPTTISMSNKSKLSIKISSLVVKVWSRIASKYGRKELKNEVKGIILQKKKCNKPEDEVQQNKRSGIL